MTVLAHRRMPHLDPPLPLLHMLPHYPRRPPLNPTLATLTCWPLLWQESDLRSYDLISVCCLQKENGEYSMPEARARSMGLLGKKWGPPPASELTRDNASTAQVNFNDDGTKNTRSNLSRRNLAGAEPTVTINTKAALADVFGMYNSPEKSTRFSAMPGDQACPSSRH
jgi:hypothetical protein